MFERPAVNIQSIPIRSFRPAPRRLGQLVSLNPNVQVQVNTGLEQYLFPVGLMLGGGASFLVGTALPDGAKPATTLVGVGLILSGVGLLIYRGLNKPAAAAPAAPSGGVPVSSGQNPPAFTPPPPDAFRALQLVIVSPQADQQLSSEGGVLGWLTGQKTIPVQLRMYNPSSTPVTFNLDFAWDEYPSFGGYDRTHVQGAKSFQVSLGAGEQKNQTFDLPVQTSDTWSQIQASLQMYTRRTPQESQQLLGNLTFTVT